VVHLQRHFLFHASFVPLIALHTDPRAESSPKWREDVGKAIATLNLQPHDALAKRCLTIIELLSPPSTLDNPVFGGEFGRSGQPLQGWGTITPSLSGFTTEMMSNEDLIQTL